MTRLNTILAKIISGNNVIVQQSKVVNLSSTAVPLCEATAPVDGKYLILSRVWIASGSSQTNFAFQNRLNVNGVVTANVSDATRGRTLAVLNYTAADLQEGDPVSLATYSSQSGSTSMTGELILIRIGT